MPEKTKVSGIEDGFVTKHRLENTSGHTKKRKDKSDHTIPPIPIKHILSSFALYNPTSIRAIKDYVESQTHDEKVQHAEKVKTEHLFDSDHDCWDVHTDRDRYWVITSPTNLYSQRYFPSLDFTLSFHIGVTARIIALQRGAPNETQKSRLSPVWRRWEEAAASYDTAEEAEDFQAVGMKCRECLIQLIRSISRAEMVPNGEAEPKRSDVMAWSELIANSIASGNSNDNIRTYLKVIAKVTWQLDNWLTHTNGATRSDATFALDATHNTVAAFGTVLIRYESGSPERCPKCGSYAIGVGYNADLVPRPYVSECEKCGWQSQKTR